MSENELLQQRVEQLERRLAELEMDVHPEYVVLQPEAVRRVREQAGCSLYDAMRALQRSRGNVEAAIYSLR